MLRKITTGLKLPANWLDYLLFFTALTAGWGAAIYYLYALNRLGISLVLVLSIGSFILLRRRLAANMRTASLQLNEPAHSHRPPVSVYALLYLLLIIWLWSDRSASALVSPWTVVSAGWFWGYALASLLLILIIRKKDVRSNLKIFLLSAHYLLSLGVAVIIYQIGYGYDPLVHQATMELIAAKGVVLPKPPYYLGQYSLIVILSKLSGLTIYWLNKIFVPALTALFLPSALYHFCLAQTQKTVTTLSPDNSRANSTALLTVLLLLSLTFSPFILTTPQNLSYLFLILTVLAAADGRYGLTGVIVLALATAVIHPLTGLPALALVSWLIFKKYQNQLSRISQKIIACLIWFGTALALPLALLLSGVNNIQTIGGVNLLLQPLQNILGNPSLAGQEDWLANFLYFLAYNYNLLIILVIVGALWSVSRYTRRDQKANQPGFNLIFLSSALLAAYWLSHQIIFNDLIGYEQSDYANRITIIIIIFCLPMILAAGGRLIAKIRQQNNLIQIIWLIFAVALLTSSLYLSYPRLDKYWNSRGYSTSADDLAAVQLISQVAPGSYIVLADQQVSAAALQVFGFSHYYQTTTGPLYFYPIPTGGPLYQYYLRAVYGQPDTATLTSARNLAGVSYAYLVINKYWYQSDRLINAAKILASKWWTINNQVYIFQYN
jgi:hypothetical protein